MMEKKTPRPPFIRDKGLTMREWKQLKRSEWKDVQRAMEKFRLGCAFVPNHDLLCKIFQLMNSVSDGMKRENWGR